MKNILSAVFISFAIAFISYSCVVLFWGRHGLIESRQLLDYKSQLHNNINQLKEYNQQLGQRIDNLRYDTDTIVLEARKLGYYTSDDYVLKLRNIEIPDITGNEVGTLLRVPSVALKPYHIFRSLFLGIFFITLIGFMIWIIWRQPSETAKKKPIHFSVAKKA